MVNSVTIKDIKSKLGTLCKKKRQALDMSQEDLGEALALSRYTIQKFESGKNATLDTTLKIGSHFGFLPAIAKEIDKAITNQNDISLY